MKPLIAEEPTLTGFRVEFHIELGIYETSAITGNDRRRERRDGGRRCEVEEVKRGNRRNLP